MDKWDERFMKIAQEVATWSSCFKDNRQVGAVIVKDKRILATGYNGAPAGVVSCKERGECIRQKNNVASGTRQEFCYAVHAEQNAILQIARMGSSTVGSTIYVTHQPCSMCARNIINAGIVRVVYLEAYPDEFTKKLFSEAKIQVEQFCKV